MSKQLPCGCTPFELPDANTYPYRVLETFHSCTRQITTYEKYERAKWERAQVVPYKGLPPEPGWALKRELYWRQVGVRTHRF